MCFVELLSHAPSRDQVAFRDPWPRAFPHRVRETAATLRAPSVTSFGAETPHDSIPVTLVSAPEPLRGSDGEVGLPSVWPEEVITIAAFPVIEDLPAPAAVNFRYERIKRSRARPDRPRPERETTGSVHADVTGSIGESRGKREPKAKSDKGAKSSNKSPRPRSADRPKVNDPIGHQIMISRPQANLTPPPAR